MGVVKMKELSNLNQKQQAQLQQLIAAINGANSKAQLEQKIKQNSGNNLESPEVKKAIAQTKYSQQEAISNIQNIINQANAEAKAADEDKEARQANNGFTAGAQSVSNSMSEFERQAIENYAKRNEINLEMQEKERIEKKLAFEKAHMRFMTTRDLARMDFEPESIRTYVKNYIHQNAVQNNFDYLNKDKKDKFGLAMATLIYSNLHYICTKSKYENKDALMNKVKTSLMDLISHNGKRAYGSKIALGMLSGYEDGSLEYDKIPTDEQAHAFVDMFSSEEVLSSFASQINNFDPDDNGVDEGVEVSDYDNANETKYNTGTFGNPVIVDEDNFTSQVLFSNPYSNNAELNPRPTNKVMRLESGKFSSVNIPAYTAAERFKKKLFESRNGTAYEFKKRWNFVLKEIKKMYPNASMVTRVAIMGTQLTVNGRLILLDDVVGGDYDIQLIDILHIRDTFKKFPMIQYMILDNEATQKMIIEYGPDAHGIWKMFQENKPLKAIGLILANNGQPINYTRESFAQTAQALDKQLSNEKWRMNMELAFASKNPRLHTKSPGYVNRLWQGGKKFGGKAWERACNNFFDDKSPKLMRFIGWSAVAVLSVGIGGILGIPGAIGSRFKKK